MDHTLNIQTLTKTNGGEGFKYIYDFVSGSIPGRPGPRAACGSMPLHLVHQQPRFTTHGPVHSRDPCVAWWTAGQSAGVPQGWRRMQQGQDGVGTNAADRVQYNG